MTQSEKSATVILAAKFRGTKLHLEETPDGGVDVGVVGPPGDAMKVTRLLQQMAVTLGSTLSPEMLARLMK